MKKTNYWQLSLLMASQNASRRVNIWDDKLPLWRFEVINVKWSAPEEDKRAVCNNMKEKMSWEYIYKKYYKFLNRSLANVMPLRIRKPRPGSSPSLDPSSPPARPTTMCSRTVRFCAIWSTPSSPVPLPRSTRPVASSRWWRTSTTSRRPWRRTVCQTRTFSRPLICTRRRTSLKSPTPCSLWVVL